MAASFGLAHGVLDATYLSEPEVEYELRARQIVPRRTDVLQRAQLRAIQINEKDAKAKKLVLPGDFDSNVVQIKTTLAELEGMVADKGSALTRQGFEQVHSRVMNLKGRLVLLNKSAVDQEEKDIVIALSSELLAIQGLVLPYQEEASVEFMPKCSSTVNPAMVSDVVRKSVHVYKWGIEKFSGKESVMTFLELVDSLRVSRGCTEAKLFFLAGDLFTDVAWVWRYNGSLKKRFADWNELVQGLKSTFMKKDYDDGLQSITDVV